MGQMWYDFYSVKVVPHSYTFSTLNVQLLWDRYDPISIP